MIVVGFLGASEPSKAPGSLAIEVARRAAATGARVEMVGAAAPGATGDKQLLQLATAGIGHATVVRSGADGLEPADLELALRYLPDVRAIVLVEPDASLLAPAAAASGWSAAGLVIVTSRSASRGRDAAPQAIVIEPPRSDPDGAFAGLVAALAVRLDAGDDPAAAWSSTAGALAVDPVT